MAVKKQALPVGIDFFGKLQYPARLQARGDALYFTLKQANFERNAYDSDLYRLEAGTVQRLTASHDIGAYALLDEGIAFASLRAPKDQEKAKNGEPLTVFQLLPYGGGEARELLRLPYKVIQAVWLPGGKLLFRAVYDHRLQRLLDADEGEMDKALTAMKEEDASVTVFDELPFWFNGQGIINKKRTALYLYDGKDTRLLTDPFANVGQVMLSPDGRSALFTQEEYQNIAPVTNQLCLLDIAAKRIKPVKGLPEGAVEACTFAGEGKALLLLTPIDAPHGMIGSNPQLYSADLAKGTATLLDAGGAYSYHNSVGTDVRMGGMEDALICQGERVLFVTTIVHDSHIVRYSPSEKRFCQLTQREGAVQEFIPYGDGYAMIAMRGDAPGEIYLLDAQGQETQISALNTEAVRAHELVTPQHISFVNSVGTTIHGWMMLPAKTARGAKLPAILDIHGGPKAAYGSVLFHEMQYWCAQGYAVLYCNPTGGDGRGDAFADIRGQYGTIDYDDVMRFVDEALTRFPCIDAERLGVTGGSYGGYMTNWIIGHNHRFRAAASQRSIANWLGFNNTSDIGYNFGCDQMKGTPWDNAEALWEASPLKHLRSAQTPTLFIHSEEDYRCNMFEGIQMFYALRAHGVPTRMCLFKGENHELSRSGKPKNRMRRLREITEWMDTYLKEGAEKA